MSPHWFVMSAAGGVLVAAVLSRGAASDEPLRLMVVDPGHFHAALLQKEMLQGVSETVHIYAPLGPDLNAHLSRIAGFNTRADHPTHWLTRVYAGPDYLDRLIAERPGNVAILSGRNDRKIDAIGRLLEAGIHVLADKPWIIEPENLPKLEAALRLADQRRLTAYDMMTQRYEIANLVQRALVNDPAVFGDRINGTAQEPAVTMESVHCLLKLVAGRPNLRPAWFFDVKQQGEGLTDVGTHLVDLVQWILFPDRAIDYHKDIQVLSGERRPTVLTLDQFQKVTGVPAFPDYLEPAVRDGRLEYFCNNTVDYTIRGARVRLVVRWDYEATAGSGDTELSTFRGSESRIDIRQGADEHYRSELYVVPNRPDRRAAIRTAVEHRLQAVSAKWPGLEVRDAAAGAFQIVIPDGLRTGHEAHFAMVGDQFRKYVAAPSSMPAWEEPNMLAKYYVTTRGVELARAAAK